MLHCPVPGAEVDPAARSPLQAHHPCCSLDSLCGRLGLNHVPPKFRYPQLLSMQCFDISSAIYMHAMKCWICYNRE